MLSRLRNRRPLLMRIAAWAALVAHLVMSYGAVSHPLMSGMASAETTYVRICTPDGFKEINRADLPDGQPLRSMGCDCLCAARCCQGAAPPALNTGPVALPHDPRHPGPVVFLSRGYGHVRASFAHSPLGPRAPPVPAH